MVPQFDVTTFEEKSISPGKYTVAAWSPKTDVVALGSAVGVVSLHRYKLGATWESQSPNCGAVTHLAWRPDGNVVAAAYEKGRLQLFNLLDGKILQSLHYDCETEICDISWDAWGDVAPAKAPIFPPFESLSAFSDDLFADRHGVAQISRPWLDSDGTLTVLMVYCDGILRLYGCGVYLFASINLPSINESPRGHKFYRMFMAHDLQALYYLGLSNDDNALSITKMKCDLSKRRQSLHRLSHHIASLLHCEQLMNAWEDTLLDLDTKLTAYSRERLTTSTDWSLRNELLEIVLFGSISPELEKFFSSTWSPMSIQRAGLAVLKAYDSMKSITFQQLQYGFMRLIAEASELLACVRDRQHFGSFQIPEKRIVSLIQDGASALQKSQELHLVISHCSNYLRPFFKWFHGVALTSTGMAASKPKVKMSETDQELVINFVSEKLKPIFAEGELKSYQIEIVEQYIRKGGVTTPVEEIFGIGEGSQHYARSKLRQLIPSASNLDPDILPDGFFCPTNASLADLIETTLADHFQWLRNSGELQSLASDAGDTMAVTASISQQGVCIQIDKIPFDENPQHKPYIVQDLEFFGSDCLLLMVYREADQARSIDDEDTQWFLFVSIPDALHRGFNLPSNIGSAGDWNGRCFDEVLASRPVPVSQLLETQRQVHLLPRKPLWLSVNGERNTIFVMFETICRVYIMERVTEEEEDDTATHQEEEENDE